MYTDRSWSWWGSRKTISDDNNGYLYFNNCNLVPSTPENIKSWNKITMLVSLYELNNFIYLIWIIAITTPCRVSFWQEFKSLSRVGLKKEVMKLLNDLKKTIARNYQITCKDTIKSSRVVIKPVVERIKSFDSVINSCFIDITLNT